MVDEQAIIPMERYNELLEKEEVVEGKKIFIVKKSLDHDGYVADYDYLYIKLDEIDPFFEEIANSIIKNSNLVVQDYKKLEHEFWEYRQGHPELITKKDVWGMVKFFITFKWMRN